MAATTATVHVRVDGRVKAKAEKALRAMGLSVSDAVRVLLTRVAEDKAFPFALEVPNAETRAAMAELERGGLKSYATFAEAMADDEENDAAEGRARHGVPSRRAAGGPRALPRAGPGAR